MKDPHASKYDGQRGFIGGAYIGPAMSRVMVAQVAADGAPVAGFFEDVGNWFSDAARDIGQAFEDAGNWLAENLDLVKAVAAVGIGLMHVAAGVCAITGVGAGAAVAIELAAVAVQKGVDWAVSQAEAGLALAEQAEAAVQDTARLASQYATGVDEVVKVASGGKKQTAPRDALPDFDTLRSKAGKGNADADRDFALATLGAVLFVTERAIPFSAGLPLSALARWPGVPGQIQVLCVWAELLKFTTPESAVNMTKAVGRWLTWKDETIQDVLIQMTAKNWGLQEASDAVADFSGLIPGAPSYRQFQVTENWLSTVKNMTSAARTSEALRLVKQYPEAEAVAAFKALAAVAPNPRAVTPEGIWKDPASINALFKSLPVLQAGTTTAFYYNPGAGGFSYDASLKGGMAAGLSEADRARWLAQLVVDNFYAAVPAGTTLLQRLSALPLAARNMGANFVPPVVSGPVVPIDAARITAAVNAFKGGDAGADLKSLARVLRSWAAGYEQRAAEYAAELERRRLAEKADYESRLAALQALATSAAKESASAAVGETPRQRAGVLVDRTGPKATLRRGTFQRTGPGRSVMVGQDNIADAGTWEEVQA